MIDDVGLLDDEGSRMSNHARVTFSGSRLVRSATAFTDIEP
jgi:hypothetical protein